MFRLGLFLVVCTLFLAADSLAVPAVVAEPEAPPPCRITLERNVPPAQLSAPPVTEDAAEIWVLTCHRRSVGIPSARIVSLGQGVSGLIAGRD